jgi:hypothetical protein
MSWNNALGFMQAFYYARGKGLVHDPVWSGAKWHGWRYGQCMAIFTSVFGDDAATRLVRCLEVQAANTAVAVEAMAGCVSGGKHPIDCLSIAPYVNHTGSSWANTEAYYNDLKTRMNGTVAGWVSAHKTICDAVGSINDRDEQIWLDCYEAGWMEGIYTDAVVLAFRTSIWCQTLVGEYLAMLEANGVAEVCWYHDQALRTNGQSMGSRNFFDDDWLAAVTQPAPAYRGLRMAMGQSVHVDAGGYGDYTTVEAAEAAVDGLPETWTVESGGITPVTVTINQAIAQADPTSASPINFTVIFSAAVTDFATGDVTLGGTAGATTAVVTGSGTTYNVAVSGMVRSGTVIASIAPHVCHDASDNPNAASTSTDNTVTYKQQVLVIKVPGTGKHLALGKR